MGSVKGEDKDIPQWFLLQNHIYSIYRKTGVRNRMQLANRINPYHNIPGN